jgi:S-adenosylmethionine/arginine decarboxylase-like enzyme
MILIYLLFTILQEFTMALVHKHLIIRAEVTTPPTDEQFIVDWMKKLIDSIGMKVLMGPYAKYLDVVGNRGLTTVAIIETSHIALHVWDEDSPSLMQLDVYTCGPLEPQLVVDAIQEFNPTKVEMKYLDRENNLTELPL